LERGDVAAPSMDFGTKRLPTKPMAYKKVQKKIK
jgi:hypothetical protein